jgi:hypothetical protein
MSTSLLLALKERWGCKDYPETSEFQADLDSMDFQDRKE